MSSVLKNEVLSKRRSNKYVHSSPALQKDEIKSNPERPRASRIPRNPMRGEATQGPKVSGCKQKSKDIFKYSESFDFETSELEPKHASSSLNKNETNSIKGSLDKRTISNKRATTKDNKDSVLETKKVRNSQNIHQNECRTHQIGYSSRQTLDPKLSASDQDSRVGNKDQLYTTNTVNDPQSPHNRSDQENIGDELIDTSQKEKNKHVEKNQGVTETVMQPRSRPQISESKKPVILKNNLEKEKVQKPVSKNTTKAFNVSDIPRKIIAKPNTSSADPTAQTRKLCKTGLSISEKNNTRNTKNETHLIQTENRFEQNNRQDLSKLSKEGVLKQKVSAKTSKSDIADSRHFNVRSNEKSEPKLNEQSLKKHNQAHRDEQDKRLQQDNVSQSLSKSITSNTSSTSSSYNGKVSGITESETEPNQAKDIQNNLSKEACSGKSSSVKKKHVPIVTETKTSVLRRSRSRSITPGSSSVSSESSHSNSTKSSTSSKSCKSSGSPRDEKIRALSKDTISKSSKSTKTQKNSENGKKEFVEPVKSYMRTTESAKNRGAVATELGKEANPASANRKQKVQLSLKSGSKQEIKSLSEKKKQEIQGGAGKISANKSKLCKPTTREATSKLKVTNARLGDVPLGNTSESADPTLGKIPFTSKDKQSKLMTTKIGNLSDKLPIKHPIRKSSTSVGNNTNIKETGSGKYSAVTTDKNLKPVRRASPKCATESESSNEQTRSANKSAKGHNSSAIKSDSCKNRTWENKSKLIAPLPRNVSSPVSKVPKHSSRSLSNKSENSRNLNTDKQDIKAKDIKSKLQQKHADKSSGREFNKKLLQPNNAQHDREINQTNGDSLREEYSSNNYPSDNPDKLLVLGEISSGKEKQLSSKENDHFCDGEYVEVKRDLFSSENIILLHETPSESDDQWGSRKILEITHCTGSLLKTEVHVMKHTGGGLTVMNDKNSVSMETICASAPECSERHENGHSSVVKLDSLSCSVNDGRAVNRLETTEGKMDTGMGSIISEQVPENNVENTMGRNVESRNISTDACSNEYSVSTDGINSYLDKCANEIISSNQLHRKHDKHVTNHEAGDVCGVAYDNPEIISDVLTSDVSVCMSSMTQNCNKKCDGVGICTSFMHDFQVKNTDDSEICKTTIRENLEQTENEQRSAYGKRYIEHESMCVCPQRSDGDRINSYMLIDTDDDSRHKWRGHGCVSQQNDNAEDKDENIKFWHTGALGSKETDNRQNETHILCSESILYKDGTSDKALSKHSTSLSSQTDEVLLHRNSCEQDQFNSQKTHHENSPCIKSTKVFCDSFSKTDYKEIDENEIICVKKQENIKNSCQTICEKSEVQGTFTSNKMKQSDKQQCKSNLCNKTVISPEIEQSGIEHFYINFCEKSIVCNDVRAKENNRVTGHPDTSCDNSIPSDRNYDQGSSEICGDGSLSVFVSKKPEENVDSRGQDTSDDVKSVINFDNLALQSSECNGREKGEELAQPCVSLGMKNLRDCQECDRFKENSYLQSRKSVQKCSVSGTAKFSEKLGENLSEKDSVSQFDKVHENENSAKLSDTYHDNCVRRTEFMQLKNEQNCLICDQLCDLSAVGSKLPVTESVLSNTLENTKNMKSTRFVDNAGCISHTDANLCYNKEFCNERMQILNNSNIFMKKHEVCDSSSDIKLSKSENMCNVVKTATQIQQTKCTPHAAGDHGKFQKTEFWDINSSLNQNQHLEYEFTEENSAKPSQDFYHNDELRNSVKNGRISETQGTVCARNSISDFCSPPDNLCLCQNEINLQHKSSSECSPEKRNETALKTSACAEYLTRFGDMELMQKEITPKVRETASPTELKQGSIVTEMNIGLNSVDQKESVKHSNMEELALRSQECENDQTSSKSEKDSARDHSIPHDICLMNLPDSDNRQELKSYNPNIHQDLSDDQMSGLSQFEFTSQDRAGFNQVFSEKATLLCDIPVINSTDQNLHRTPLTSATEFEKSTCKKHSWHISDITESKNEQLITECVCNLQTINSNQSGHVIKGSNFIADKTGNQFSVFDGKQPESFDSVLKDGDYHFNITERLDIQGSGGSELCECSNTELTDIKSASLSEPLDYDIVDGQIFTKSDKFGFEVSQEGIKLCSEIDLSSKEKESTFFKILPDVSAVDNSVQDREQCRIETNLNLNPQSVNESNVNNLKEITKGQISVSGSPQNNTSQTARLTVQQSLNADNCDFALKHQDSTENGERVQEIPIKSKFIKTGSNLNIKQIATSCTEDSQAGRSTESLTEHSLISHWGSIQVQNSTNRVCVNAGEALCDNVSDITDLFDDTGDDFVDAEETLGSELDTTDIDITNSSSCDSDLNKQGDILFECDLDDIASDAISGIVTGAIPNAGDSNGGCTDIYKCRESLTSTESFQDAFDDFVEDPYNAFTLQRDKTPENENFMSQISSSLSRCSQKGVKDDKNVDINEQTIISEGNSTLVQNPDDSMERRRRREISTITTTVTGSSTVKHVQASEFRNSSAINDNAYQCNTPSSDLKETQHIVQTNVSRSSDKRNESEHGVIANVIHKTGSSVLPVDSCIPQTGEKEALFSQTLIETVQSIFDTVDKGDETESENQPVQFIIKNESSLPTSIPHSSTVRESLEKSCSSTCNVSDGNNSNTKAITTSSEDSSKATKESMSNVMSSDKIGRKIETAVTIRTQRRRRRQVQQINTQSDLNACSNSVPQERTDLRDLSGETECNAGVNKISKIESEGSTLISSRSEGVTFTDVSASVSEDSIENMSCSQLSDSSVVLRSIENVPESNDFDSILPSDSQDSCFIDQQTDSDVCDNSIVLTQSENKLTSCERNVNLSSVDTTRDETKLVDNDNTGNESLSNVYCNSDRNLEKESNSNDVRIDQPPFTVSVQKVLSRVNDNNFDDIEFIDADDIPEVQKECPSSGETREAIDRSRKLESPNASFIVTFEIASDEEIRNNDIEVINKSSSESDNASGAQENKNSITGQVNDTEYILNDNRSQEILENVETNVIIKDKVQEYSNDNDILVSVKSDPSSCKTTSEQVPKNVVNLATDSETRIGKNVSDIEIQVRPLAESYTSDNEDPEIQEVNISNQDDGLESVVSEESNISVAHALKLEREKLNELNNNCSNTEESGRSRSRTPGRRNIRSASTGNFILQLQKSDTEEVNTVLSNIKSGLSKRSIKKSSSFRIERKNAYPAEEENGDNIDTMKNAGKKVSDICRSFVQKARSSSRPRADEESGMVKSPTPQRKLMKWVNDNGKWLRIPVYESIGDRKDREIICQQTEDIANVKHGAQGKIQDKPDLQIPAEEAKEHCEDTNPEYNTSNINVVITENTDTTDSEQVIQQKLSVKENVTDKSENIIEIDAVSTPSNTDNDNATDTPFVVDTNEVKGLRLSQGNLLQSPKILTSKEILACGQESSHTENKDGLLPREQSQPDQKTNGSKAGTVMPGAVPSIVCPPPPTKLKPKLHLDIQKANETSESDSSDLARSYTAPVEITHEISNDKESSKMNRSDFLLGIKDNMSRRKLVKMLSPTRSPQEPDFKSGSVDPETTPDDTIPSPKRIPKLTAVKIQEEIFEGKPEYMKQCNIDPLGMTEETGTGKNLVSYFNSKRELRELKRSRTFTSMEDAKTGSKSHIFETKDKKETKPSIYDYRESEMLRAPGGASDDLDILTDVVERTTTAKSDKRKLKVPILMRDRSLQRPKLLSEIVEVEENKDELQQTANNNRSKQHGEHEQQQPSNNKKERKLRKSGTTGNKRRSLSLPTGSLAFGDARIVYKNGHFTIETMEDYEFDSARPPDSDEDNDPNFVNKMHVTADSSSRRREGVVVKDYSREATHLLRPGLKRQRAKTALTKRDSDDSVFYNQADSVNHFDEDASEISSNSSHISEISHGSGDLERDDDFHEHQKSNQSSSSLPETASSPSVKQEALRARRTSSFRRAQESGVLRLTDHSEEQVKDDPKQKIPSSNESNQNPSSSKTTQKKKSLNENMTLFSKQSESAKDFFSKKMNLKGLFKKNKPDLGLTSGSPLKLQHPVSPPIAAFQGDDDIGSIDTPPGSPGPRHDFRRRHTSADVYIRSFADATASESGSNCPTPTQERHNSSFSTPTTPSRESNSIMNRTSNGSVCSVDEDRISVTSASSAASSSHSSIQSPGMEQPHKPKTPKPVGASPRRSHSIGSQASRTSYQFVHRDRTSTSVTSLESDNCDDMLSKISIEGRCECEYKASFPRSRSDSKASVDSIQLCQFCKNYLEYVNSSGLTSGASVDKHRKSSSSKLLSLDDNISAKSRKDSLSSRTSYEKLAIVTQQDVVSSNSNDSGIQRDVSAHSSNESIKGTQDTPVKFRRKKSLSPHTERPKSEAGVRWADLDLEASGFNQPVRFRSSARRFKDRPRPKSDLDDSIQLFDELFEEILEDFETEGSSFLSDRVKAFGSEINLQPYCSLRNLYDMKKQEFDKRKNRRMSTPHPIKSRLQRSPKKLQKQPPLVRSSSMPESLDKITKRRKLHLLDFHMDSLQRHLDAEECYSDDSDLSFDHVSLQERSLSIQSSQSQLASMDEEEDNLIYAEALWDHITMVPDEIGFRAQDVIEVMDMRDKDWWYGAIDDKEGWFPAAFVRLRVNQDQIEEEDLEMTLQDNSTSSPKSRRISMLNKNQARTNVVNEIINAEREYVKHLKDVVEGYIQHARKRSEMFPEERIALIFGNIETIYSFARKFLGNLEKCIDVCPHLSEIGQCFLDNERGFEVYSDYCNNHPSACEELKELCQDSKYRHFFEACRLLQDLVEIPLEGFLLTPVQKICKYPLQLAELLKYTPPDHSDYETVRDALSAMRKIATLINERKRKMESIEKIAAWQHTVADWDGEDLLERSSELIFSGEINKVNTAGWSQERYFFLFDHQLIYCKKELLKRHVFSHKGRIDLDHCDVIDVFDGRDVQYNVSVKHAWKLHETHKDKWYLLYSKTQAGKDRWLKALRDERKRVQEDRDNDFCVPDHWKQTVLNKVRSQSSLKDKQPTSRVNPSHQVPFQKDLKDFAYSTLPRRRISSQKQDKKKGWFIFGGKKSKR